MAVMELDPLLETLNKLSEGRIVRAAEIVQEGEFTRVRIPVRLPHAGDKVDVALRRYAADWIRLQRKDVSVDTKYERLPAGVSFFHEGQEIRVTGQIVLSWWPRPEIPDYEQIKRMQAVRRGTSAE